MLGECGFRARFVLFVMLFMIADPPSLTDWVTDSRREFDRDGEEFFDEADKGSDQVLLFLLVVVGERDFLLW